MFSSGFLKFLCRILTEVRVEAALKTRRISLGPRGREHPFLDYKRA